MDKLSNDLIGFCGVGPEKVDRVEEVNLGYRLAKRYWSQGLASEAAKGVLDYAFYQKKLTSVVVIIESGHVASLRVAEKSGFEDFQEIIFHDRQVRLYRMIYEQWRRLHSQAMPTTSV